MPVKLKNSQIELLIDFPTENYQGPRFDHCGKIVSLKYDGICLSGSETGNKNTDQNTGKGFYNEFGIDLPLNFDKTPVENWFHKIGVGFLKKSNSPYYFKNIYEVKPLSFKVEYSLTKIVMECTSPLLMGYAYKLKKEILLIESGFIINYYLENIGDHEIITNEYVHNFLIFNQQSIGTDYQLNVPFEIKPELFIETVNPENKVFIGKDAIHFNKAPSRDFFFSNLSGNELVNAKWEIINKKLNLGMSETGDFKTNTINLWGVPHVMCPELFININLKPKEFKEWSRTYSVFKL
ncbi:MAG TPA: hypothetical protein VIS27_14930 [Yeosuana sp.]